MRFTVEDAKFEFARDWLSRFRILTVVWECNLFEFVCDSWLVLLAIVSDLRCWSIQACKLLWVWRSCSALTVSEAPHIYSSVSMLFNHLLCLVFRPFFELMTTGWVCSDQPNSFELYHVQVVKWHEMPVSTKDVHESLRIYDSSVSVTGCRFLTIDKAKFGTFLSVARYIMILLSGAKVSSLSLSHLLEVCVETLISVLDQECVLHGDRGRGRKTVLFLSSGRARLFDFWWWFQGIFGFQTWSIGCSHQVLSLSRTHSLLSASRWRLFLILSLFIRSCVEWLWSFATFVCIFSTHKFILSEVEDYHII